MIKTLITGSTGFLGIHVKQLLPDAVCPTRDECNLLSDIQTKGMMIHYQPDVVIHLAAFVGGIGLNQKHPAQMLVDNILMNINVFEACRIANVKKIITVGSVCAYPKFCPVPFIEDDIYKGKPEDTNAFYGESKRVLMQLCESYQAEYDIECVYLIPTNLYGEGDNFKSESSHVIPALIKKIFEAKQNNLPLEVWGTGNASRDFLYVKDCANAIVKAIDYHVPEIVNLGSGNAVRINELVGILCNLIGYKGEIIWNSNKPDGQPKRQLNIDRSKKYLNWQPKTPFVTGLIKTIEYYETTYL